MKSDTKPLRLEESEFQKLNRAAKRNDGKEYVNPRNAAAGSLRQKDSTIAATRNLSFWAYQLGEVEEGPELASHYETLEFLSSLELPVNENAKLVKDIAGALGYIQEFQEARDSLDYEFDGIVIKVDSLLLQEELGNTATYFVSDLSRSVTGEVHYVDCGFNIVGMPKTKI